MKKIHALPALPPHSDMARTIAWLYAGVLVVMVIAQLFAFEDFIPLIQNYELPGGQGTATLVAGLIVIYEVFAIPFLLRMRLSPLFRWFSLICGLLVAAVWAFLAFWATLHSIDLTNSGLLGTKVKVAIGWPQLLITVTLAVLAIASTVGLWPVRRK